MFAPWIYGYKGSQTLKHSIPLSCFPFSYTQEACALTCIVYSLHYVVNNWHAVQLKHNACRRSRSDVIYNITATSYLHLLSVQQVWVQCVHWTPTASIFLFYFVYFATKHLLSAKLLHQHVRNIGIQLTEVKASWILSAFKINLLIKYFPLCSLCFTVWIFLALWNMAALTVKIWTTSFIY